MKTLVITVWGNPRGWKPARYSVERRTDKKSIEPYPTKKEYKSTLGALMEAYPDANILLFVSSTLGSLLSKKTYSEMLNEISKKIIENYLKNSEYCENYERVSLRVLPGIGRFKDNGSEKIFRGRIDMFRTAAFISSYEEMIKNDPDKIILDISHGVNYMPVYVKSSVYTALLGYSALANHEIIWQVYNSEPKTEEVEELAIMEVEYAKIKQDFSIKWLYREFEVLFDSNFNFIKSNIGKTPPRYSSEWNTLNTEVAKIIRAINNGLLIPFVETASRLASINTESLASELKKFSYLENCDEIIEINNNELCYLFTPNPISMHLLAITNIMKKINIKLEKYDEGYEIDSLEKITEEFIGKPASIMIENELSQIRERVKLVELTKRKFTKWEPYNVFIEIGDIRLNCKVSILEKYRRLKDEGEELSKFKEELKEEKVQEEITKAINSGRNFRAPDERNFLAHAGLERNVTQILCNEGRIYIKYNDEKKKEIENILKNIL